MGAPKAVGLSLDTSLLGVSSVAFEELVDRVPAAAVLARVLVLELAHAYLTWCVRFGLDVRVLWAQMLLETDGLRFGGEVLWNQNNFCGLRIPDGSGYYSFDSVTDGAAAHVAHMAAHTYHDHHPCCALRLDPKHPALHYGDVTVIADLERGPTAWCPSPGYASKIVRVWEMGV